MKRGTPKLRVVGCDAALQELRTRMPFRYSRANLTVVPLLFVRVHTELGGKVASAGFASECLPPHWFDKDPAKSFRKNVEDILKALEIARRIYLEEGASARPIAALWEASHPRIVEEGAREGLNALTCSFGGACLERGLIDSLARTRKASFFEILSRDLLGMETSPHLPPKPVRSFHVRHTVGLSDPITVGEIPDGQRLADGLPQALEEDIEAYGLTHFKLKLSGVEDRDLARLSRIAALFHQRCRDGYRVTLDGNEQFGDPSLLEHLLEALRSKPYGEELLRSVLFIEQPLPRDMALDRRRSGDIRRLTELKPIIIDESDDSLDAFERAIGLGYRGVSHKNSKGVLKSLCNRALVVRLNKEAGKPVYFQTGEDLVTLPVIPLQEDLATLAALGVEHVERNGHHYFHGLDHLTAMERGSVLARHPDLYEEVPGGARLRIEEGKISCDSIQCPGYGYASEVAFDSRVPLAQWSFDRLGPEAEEKAEGGADVRAEGKRKGTPEGPPDRAPEEKPDSKPEGAA